MFNCIRILDVVDGVATLKVPLDAFVQAGHQLLLTMPDRSDFNLEVRTAIIERADRLSISDAACLSKRTQNVLLSDHGRSVGPITTVGQAFKTSVPDLLTIPGLGVYSLGELNAEFLRLGLVSLGQVEGDNPGFVAGLIKAKMMDNKA